MTRTLLALLCSLIISACATGGKPATTETRNIPIDQLEPDFLYLAAQDAMQNGNTALAIRLLKTFVTKVPDATEPRLQLANLLLSTGEPKQAARHIDHLLASNTLNPEERNSTLLLKARVQAIAGDSKGALATLDEILDRDSKHLLARQFQIRLLLGLEAYTDAHLAIQEAINIQDTPELRQIQANIYMEQGLKEEAWQAAKAMQKLAPDNDTPVMLLSRIAEQQNKPELAESLLRDFLKKHPDALRASNMLGSILIRRGRTKEAIDIYRELSDKTGRRPEILSALGMLLYETGEYRQALEIFKEAQTKQPDDQNLFYIGGCLEMMENFPQAIKHYESIGMRSPLYPDAQTRLAGIEIRQEKLSDALARLKKVIRIFKNHVDAYTMLSFARLAQQKYELLLEETAPAMELHGFPLKLLFNRAIAYDALKDYPNLEKSLEKLLSINPEHAEALNFLGYSYAERGIKLDEAEALIQKALKLKKNDGYYLDSLAWVYFKQAKYKKAEATQQKALGIEKGDPLMHEHMGDILWKRGKQKEAREAWQKALSLKHAKPETLRKKLKDGI